MLWHGAQAGAFDLKAAVLEAMTAFRRAGEQAGVGLGTCAMGTEVHFAQIKKQPQDSPDSYT